jgi:hypothetical protein
MIIGKLRNSLWGLLKLLAYPFIGIWSILKFVDKHTMVLTLVATGIAVYGLKLTLDSRISNEEFKTTVATNLTKLNTQFANFEKGISNLHESVNKFDTAVVQMGSQIGRVGENISAFGSTLDNLGSATDKQLALIKETQKQWELELSKKADLLLVTSYVDTLADSLFVTLGIINIGKKISTPPNIMLVVPKYLNFSGSGWRLALPETDPGYWNFKVNESISPAGDFSKSVTTTQINRFKFILPKNKRNSDIILDYVIRHEIEQRNKVSIPTHCFISAEGTVVK